jgi:hypothetical protein
VSHSVRLLSLDEPQEPDSDEEETRRAGGSVRQPDRQIDAMPIHRSLGVGGRSLSSVVPQGGTQEDALCCMKMAQDRLQKYLQALAGREKSGAVKR